MILYLTTGCNLLSTHLSKDNVLKIQNKCGSAWVLKYPTKKEIFQGKPAIENFIINFLLKLSQNITVINCSLHTHIHILLPSLINFFNKKFQTTKILYKKLQLERHYLISPLNV